MDNTSRKIKASIGAVIVVFACLPVRGDTVPPLMAGPPATGPRTQALGARLQPTIEAMPEVVCLGAFHETENGRVVYRDIRGTRLPLMAPQPKLVPLATSGGVRTSSAGSGDIWDNFSMWLADNKAKWPSLR